MFRSFVGEACGHETGLMYEFENCVEDCPSEPTTCAEMEGLLSPGECASDCSFDFLYPYYEALMCEFDLSEYIQPDCIVCEEEGGARSLLFGDLPCCE